MKPRIFNVPQMFEAFHNPNYRFLWPSNFLSYASRWTQVTILGWLILERTGSPFLVALVAFFAWSPMLFLGLVGGYLADSVNRQKVLLFSQSVTLISTLLMTALLLTDLLEIWHSYLIITVNGSVLALEVPSRRSLIHTFLGNHGVANGVALDFVALSASRMLGPILAGLLTQFWGFVGGYLLVVIFHFVCICLLLNLKIHFTLQPSKIGSTIFGDLLHGIRYVKNHHVLIGVVAISLTMHLLLYPYVSMVPVIAGDLLNIGPGFKLGMLQSAAGIGALTGAIVLASIGNINFYGRIFMFGAMLTMFSLLLFSFSTWYEMSFAVLIFLGVGTAVFGTMQATLIMILSSEDVRGKVIGVITLIIGIGPFGTLSVGAVADIIDASFALGFNAILGIGLLIFIVSRNTNLFNPITSNSAK